jgi:hypothetical protein
VAIVKNTLRNPATGGALGREQVTIKLVSGSTGGFIGSSVEVLDTRTIRTDSTGLWSEDLTPNALITPANTYYTVTQFGETLSFVVPNTAGPFWLLDILVQSPTSPSGLVVGVLASRQIIAGTGLTGGGDLTADRTLAVGDLSATYALVTTFDVRTFGAVCDGATNDSTAVAAAALAASTSGGRVLFPKGTTVAGSIPIYTNVHYVGAGYGATTVKAPASTNADVFITNGFAGLTGGGTNAGPYNFSLRNMTIDANKTGNASAGRCISIYGQNYTLDGLRCYNARGIGIWSESYTGTAGGVQGGPESHWNDVKIIDSEQMAVKFLGPHDTIWHAVEGFNCARTSGDAIFDLTGVKLVRCHGWGGYHATTFILRASCQVSGTDMEGGSLQQCLILANDQSIEGCHIYNGQAGANSSYGVTIGDGTHTNIAGYKINAKFLNTGDGSGGGALHFVSDGGSGSITGLIYQAAGNMQVGTPNAATRIDVLCYGGATAPAFTTVNPSNVNTQYLGGTWYDGATRFRANSSGQITSFQNANPIWAVDSTNKFMLFENALKLRGYSDAATTRTFEWDTATGFITFGTTTGSKITWGSGSPETVVTAPVGSLFLRSDGSAGTAGYIKESGTGNTGWTAFPGTPSAHASSHASGGSDPTDGYQLFTGSGTWTQPTNVTRVRMRAIGGGGGGGGGGAASTGIAQVGGGGGAAGTVWDGELTVSGNLTVTVGGAGTAGSAGASGGGAGGNGGVGGNTTVTGTGVSVTANGSGGGSGGGASSTTAVGGGMYGRNSNNTTLGVPGKGASTNEGAAYPITPGVVGGGAGGAASATLGGLGGSAQTTVGSVLSLSGTAGAAGTTAGTAGTAATTPGGGGGGGGGGTLGTGAGGIGGVGAAGSVEVWWTV